MVLSSDIGAALVQVADEHPELHHYTSFEGLLGIIRSNALWATKYNFLNDNTETKLLPKFLLEDVVRIARKAIQKNLKGPGDMSPYVKEAGGLLKASRNLATSIVDVLHRGVYEPEQLDSAQPTLAMPFFTSFCAHSNDEKYIKNNGLLSQWRGYGAGGGYAIVFDTSKLAKALSQETFTYMYNHVDMRGVVYSNENKRVSEIKQTLLPSIAEVCRSATTTSPKGPGKIFLNAYVQASTSIKHEGFFEEREVRIVMSPMKAEDIVKLDAPVKSEFESLRDGHPEIKFKTVNLVPETNRPYISLFESNGSKLPIKRIIVGPSRQQRENLEKIKGLFRQDLIIRCSETPFVG